MRQVEPRVFVTGRTIPDYDQTLAYLREVGGAGWQERTADAPHGEFLTAFSAKLCYRAWEPGLNPNVTKVRGDLDGYLRNILAQGHGSVLEHVTYNFVFHHVSRVFTHEACRHRAGVAISQESMRYVRLDDIPFWFPGWFTAEHPDLAEEAEAILAQLEWFQRRMAQAFALDDAGTPFAEKKHKTSFMRRFAPDGVATTIAWSANLRELRHVIAARTAPGAEEEIRLVFGKVAEHMTAELPSLFGDFTRRDDGSWVPDHPKV